VLLTAYCQQELASLARGWIDAPASAGDHFASCLFGKSGVVLVFGRQQKGGSARSTDRRPKTSTKRVIDRSAPLCVAMDIRKCHLHSSSPTVIV
jgi:hypothetical protein